ncbi:hypothetical protein [Nocardiopsis sp. FIRDI 009]|uniref:hypothetical protein n=1 Tax=Nocardiopsis sp. FIRDI 009 TaxID=714197 RepID=UPI000E285DE6|nr:hypothetical protein [Nocardiopsis sp. FIRDI 009]
MSLRDRLRTALTGQTPEDRARHEATRKQLKKQLEESIRETEEEIRVHDLIRDPKRNLNAGRITAADRRMRDQLVNDLNYARRKLRDL